MADLGGQAVEGGNTHSAGEAQPDEQARPDWLPEKFWNNGQPNYQALAQSYKELEAKRVEPTQDPQQGPTPNPDTMQTLESMAQEFIDEGELSDNSYNTLEQMGYDRKTVDAYLEGQRAIQELQEQSAYGVTGSKENYQRMAEWLAVNKDDAWKTQFNQNVQSTDRRMVQNAVASAYQEYMKATGGSNNMFSANQTGGSTGYSSTEEMRAEMADPRYGKDPAYTQSVIDKLRVSNPFDPSVRAGNTGRV